MKRRKLGRTGLEVSELGFGASPLGAVYGPFAQRDGIEAVHKALDLGIDFFDVAPFYGATAAETVLGKALHGIERSSYVLATKVGRYGEHDFDFSAARVARSVRESLTRLGTDHLDLIQCHDIEFGDLDQIAGETLPALRGLQDAGLVRCVGITGYPLPALAYVADRAEVDTIMSYCQYTLQDRRLTPWLRRFAAQGIGVINAAPLAMGALTPQGPPPWHPARAAVLKHCAAAARLCAARGGDLARLALQFALATGDSASTVVGASHPSDVSRNVRWVEEPLDEQLLREVELLLAPIRDVGWVSGRPENQHPGAAA
ncbi:aldo/keto reductase [Actinocrinis puniceicyclus]|uniref:Aldo/keto reductase n=1 Tax=Actinocrinis puniceicyclus TaxID=977794 RepID=A0A8J8BE19_9ACTN|nr:aldo/keto reductase [Actinocrinis puniceicyclus]MBS2965888.1 aldo/keto reductase [Actinocrinis puniceicyclus]